MFSAVEVVNEAPPQASAREPRTRKDSPVGLCSNLENWPEKKQEKPCTSTPDPPQTRFLRSKNCSAWIMNHESRL